MTTQQMLATRTAAVIVAVLIGGGGQLIGQVVQQTTSPDSQRFDAQVRPFLVRHCLECHGGEKPKGDFRLDDLGADLDAHASSPTVFGAAASRDGWLAVLRRVQAGEMPPESKPRPPVKDVAALAEWIQNSIAAADAAEGRVVLRRLNRVEYENTARDLLGVIAARGVSICWTADHEHSILSNRFVRPRAIGTLLVGSNVRLRLAARRGSLLMERGGAACREGR